MRLLAQLQRDCGLASLEVDLPDGFKYRAAGLVPLLAPLSPGNGVPTEDPDTLALEHRRAYYANQFNRPVSTAELAGLP